MKHIASKGWSSEAISAGAQDLGYSVMSHGLFPSGGYELVSFFMTRSTALMSHEMSVLPLDQMTTNEKIRKSLRLRLEMLSPFISTWPQALALGILPQNLPTTLHNIAALSDDIWSICGCRSTDMNWYSKRALLGGVYVSTELYMITDHSDNFANTWEFMDRRLDDVKSLGKLPNTLRNMVFNAPNVFTKKPSKPS